MRRNNLHLFPIDKYTKTQRHKDTKTQIHKDTNTQRHKYTNTQTHKDKIYCTSNQSVNSVSLTDQSINDNGGYGAVGDDDVVVFDDDDEEEE